MTPLTKYSKKVVHSVLFRYLILGNFLVTFWFLFVLAGQVVKQHVPALAKGKQSPAKPLITLAQIK